jgi:organic hydroperoxide reductase OsmC/OhrA
MIDRADYRITVTQTGTSGGVALAPDAGLPPLTVLPPPEFGGPEGEWTPEHLFVAAVASCFLTTFQAIARASRLEFTEVSVPAVGTLERAEDRRFRFTRVVLRPRIVILEDKDRERAVRIAEKAEGACLVSRSLSTAVALEPQIEVGQECSAATPC